MIQNKNIVVVKGDEDASIVIMKKSGYVTKSDIMIDDGIIKGTYLETTKSTLKISCDFRTFLIQFFMNMNIIKV